MDNEKYLDESLRNDFLRSVMKESLVKGEFLSTEITSFIKDDILCIRASLEPYSKGEREFLISIVRSDLQPKTDEDIKHEFITAICLMLK